MFGRHVTLALSLLATAGLALRVPRLAPLRKAATRASHLAPLRPAERATAAAAAISPDDVAPPKGVLGRLGMTGKEFKKARDSAGQFWGLFAVAASRIDVLQKAAF